MAELSKEDIETYLSDRLTEISATTVAIRFRSLRALFRWMESEEIVSRSPMAGMREPAVEDNPPPVLMDDELRALLAACSGKSFEARRDEAIIRTFSETGGPMLGEVAGLVIDDLDLKHDLITLRGKGRKTRLIPFGAKTGSSLDRYLRLRGRHPERTTDGLWLGCKGALSPSGIAQLLDRRARTAGLGRIHPHQLRHTSAHRWALEGGSEADAMMLFGWSHPDMPRRYGRSAGVERAQSASRRQSLGDRL